MIRSGLIPLMLDDYKDILKRALRIEIEVQRIDIRKVDRKKFKFEKVTKPEVKKTKDEAEQQKIFSYPNCGRNHGGVCYEKIGACYTCKKIGH